MGVVAAAWATAAVAAGSAAYGVAENEKAQDANEQLKNESKDDYQKRLETAGEWAKKLQDQYNKVVKQRPKLAWSTYVKEQLAEIDDPTVRQFYLNAKQEDFDNLQRFANAATSGNTSNLLKTAEEISGGEWRNYMDKRNELINQTTAADRFIRANELAAPNLTDPSTVRFDSEGRLIEGQRADKQRFNIAYEQQAAAEQEQKQDLRAISNDVLSAAQSQQEKAGSFTQFFDPTAFSAILAGQHDAKVSNYQQLNEERAWSIYDTFTKAAQGIQPTQPNYGNPNPGNQMIADSIKMGTGALTDYYKAQASRPSSTDYMGNKTYNITGASGSGANAPRALTY